MLLSAYNGPSITRNIAFKGSVYTVSVSGPGLEYVSPAGKGRFNISLYGTSAASTFNVVLTNSRPRAIPAPLDINTLKVTTHHLGSINASEAILSGKIAPLAVAGTVSLNAVGSNAQATFTGGLGDLTIVGPVNLGPTGFINIQGNVSGPIQVGSIALHGGSVNIQGSELGGLTAGEISIDGGTFAIAQDASGAIHVGQDMLIAQGGSFAVGRDLLAGLSIGNALTLDSGGNLSVGREFNNLSILGNFVVTPTGGGLNVGGDLSNVTVTGVIQGKGSNAGVPDINVGLNLNNLSVEGGGQGQGSIREADIEAGKDLVNPIAAHGIFYSFLYAGVLIQGGGTAAGFEIGPDGNDAVYNSEIRAGAEINQITINGNVRSTFVQNPASIGYPTRIIAGENRQGVFSNGGNIDNFQILGAMYDSVLAASVVPYGGDGTLPPGGYAPPPSYTSTPGDLGQNTYDAPAGKVAVGTFGIGNFVTIPNYTETNVFNETTTGVAYNHSTDPTIDDAILYGAINPSFVQAPIPIAGQTSSANIPLPTKSTVLGGVYSTPHNPANPDAADFAGIFAANTRGVFVGSLPH